MMPIIRPMIEQCDPPTEYQNERAIFAKMKVDLRKGKQRFLRLRTLFRRHASDVQKHQRHSRLNHYRLAPVGFAMCCSRY